MQHLRQQITGIGLRSVIFRPSVLIALILIAILNIILNLTLLPVFGIIVSSLAMLAYSVLYIGFILVLSYVGRRKLGPA